MSNPHSYRWRLLKTSLTPPLFTKVRVPRQESDRSCICVLGVFILPLFCNFDIWFWNCSESVVFLMFLFTSLCFYSFSLFTVGTYLPEEYHIAIECILFICCVGLILKKQKQQIYQPFSYIARLIRLNNTNTDPPDIQVPTMQRLMGGDENGK